MRPIFGQTAAGKISLLLVGFRWLVLVFICLPLRSLLRRLSGEWLESSGMLVWNVAVLLCKSLDPCRLFSVLNFRVAIIALQSYWPCHLRLDNLNVARSIGRLLDRGCLAEPLPLVKDEDLVAVVEYMIRTRVRKRSGSPRSQGMPRTSWVVSVWRISLVMLRLTLLLIWVGVISRSRSWMLGVPCLMPVTIGIPSCCNFIDS